MAIFRQMTTSRGIYFAVVADSAQIRIALTPLLILCVCVLSAQVQARSPAVSHDKPVEHISFVTEDGGLIYADLYGNSDRGLVLAHGGRFTKESWRPQAQLLAKAGFRVLAFDFRGFGKSHGPGDSDMYTAPMQLDVLAAVHYLRSNGAKTVAVMGGSFGGTAAADASIASSPGEINRLILLAGVGNGAAERIKAPLLVIVSRDDANSEGPRLPNIRAWFDKAPQPKELIVLNGSAHAQFLFQTDQSDRVMNEVLRFLRTPNPSSRPSHGRRLHSRPGSVKWPQRTVRATLSALNLAAVSKWL